MDRLLMAPQPVADPRWRSRNHLGMRASLTCQLRSVAWLCLTVGLLTGGVPIRSWAEVSHQNGDSVEVKKGTKLCDHVVPSRTAEASALDNKFWRVTSLRRANGTQTVSAFVLERVYDRKSGNTTWLERLYDEGYAMRFQRDPDHAGVLFMINPEDGQVEASVGVCQKAK